MDVKATIFNFAECARTGGCGVLLVSFNYLTILAGHAQPGLNLAEKSHVSLKYNGGKEVSSILLPKIM